MAFQDVSKRSAVTAAIKEFNKSGRAKFLSDHGYRNARRFFLIQDGKEYDSKAILGVAHGYQFGKPLSPYAFSGGEATVRRVLQKLGFEVIDKQQEASGQAKSEAGWSDAELKASVAGYLTLLEAFNANQPANKRAIYKKLSDKFGRSEKAIEYRMQNISYALSLMGRRWIKGLPPAKNVGAAIGARIEMLILSLQGQVGAGVVEEKIQAKAARQKIGSTPPRGNDKPSGKQVMVTQYVRDLAVKAWVLNEAKGVCECCGNEAPFSTSDGPFLEVHHLLTLAEGGSDTICNAIAICPNCHRRLHYAIDASNWMEQVYARLPRLIRGSGEQK